MIKKFNYTGRKRIPRSSVDLQVLDGNPARVDFRADQLKEVFPGEAQIHLDAYSSGSPASRRLAWGTVAEPTPPRDQTLGSFEPTSVFFNLTVVEPATGRLLGRAENLRAKVGKGSDEDATRQWLLPVAPMELGDLVWRLDFEHDQPQLQVNKQIQGILQKVRSDPTFFALVFPEVVERILQYILLDREETDPSDDPDSWAFLWLRWAVQVHPERATPPTESASDEDKAAWIQDVAQAFSGLHEVRVKYVAATLEGD